MIPTCIRTPTAKLLVEGKSLCSAIGQKPSASRHPTPVSQEKEHGGCTPVAETLSRPMSGRPHGTRLLPGYSQVGFTTPEFLRPDPYVLIMTWVSLCVQWEQISLSEPVYFKSDV